MLGMVGGGQLGRYFVVAARTMGYRVTVLEPDAGSPAGALADVHLCAAYDDPDALAQMAATCAVVTTEFENAPADAMRRLAADTIVRPSADALAICQDRVAEKDFLARIGIPVAPYRVISAAVDIEAAADFAFPAILKTARLGYDGKGQVTCASYSDLQSAWRSLGAVRCVLEQRLPLDGECSVVLGRSPDGRTACYPIAHNEHQGGILDLTSVPAPPLASAQNPEPICARIAEQLGFVGVMAVEMFIVGGQLIVNELAPRPHNSGHFTLDACACSQFEQQVRAVCGLALGDTRLRTPGVAMVNLLGDLWSGGEPQWDQVLANPAAHLHLYGKASPRPGRKMGHVTVLSDSVNEAVAIARTLRSSLSGS